MTKQEILEKHYTKYEKRIGYPSNVFAAMDEYAQQQVKIFSSNLPVSGSDGNERGILLNDFLVWMGKEKLMGSSVSARKNLIEEFEKSFNSR